MISYIEKWRFNHVVDKGLINFLQLVIKLLRVHFPVSHKHKPIPTHCVQHSDLESGGGN